MRFYENEQGKYRDGDIGERVIKKDRKNYLEIRPFHSTTVSYNGAPLKNSLMEALLFGLFYCPNLSHLTQDCPEFRQ